MNEMNGVSCDSTFVYNTCIMRMFWINRELSLVVALLLASCLAVEEY